MKSKTLRIPAFLAPALMLAACDGGGGSPTPPDGELDRLRSDPKIVRLEGIIQRSDTLLIPSNHFHYTITAEGETVSERLVERTSCAGSRCVGEDGTETTVGDLIDFEDPFADIGSTAVNLGSRSGFDTITATGNLDIEADVSADAADFRLAADLNVDNYGFWGEHGFAAVQLLAASLSGQAEGTPYHGKASYAAAFAVGDATGTNPVGMGSATWRGIAEAASTRTFERRQGAATVTIADLSRPRVSVGIDVPGYAIDASAWADMPLAGGRFASGTTGRDYLEGNFHGPDHGETYGVFDTGAYIGVFGAKRDR